MQGSDIGTDPLVDPLLDGQRDRRVDQLDVLLSLPIRGFLWMVAHTNQDEPKKLGAQTGFKSCMKFLPIELNPAPAAGVPPQTQREFTSTGGRVGLEGGGP